jgi:hypothetical protein
MPRSIPIPSPHPNSQITPTKASIYQFDIKLRKKKKRDKLIYLGERGVAEERDDAGIIRVGLEIRIFVIL